MRNWKDFLFLNLLFAGVCVLFYFGFLVLPKIPDMGELFSGQAELKPPSINQKKVKKFTKQTKEMMQPAENLLEQGLNRVDVEPQSFDQGRGYQADVFLESTFKQMSKQIRLLFTAVIDKARPQ